MNMLCGLIWVTELVRYTQFELGIKIIGKSGVSLPLK